MSHPVPFMKASSITVTKKVGKEMPDLEEAIEEEDDDAVVDAAEAVEDDELDIKGDKYIKQPKKGGKKTAPKKASKAKAVAAEDEEDEDATPAKGKGKGKAAAARGRGKAKK